MKTEISVRLSAKDADTILNCLPETIRVALTNRATDINYPVEAVIEMAIASYLDTEALGFADCHPWRGN